MLSERYERFSKLSQDNPKTRNYWTHTIIARLIQFTRFGRLECNPQGVKSLYAQFEILFVQIWEFRFTLGLNAAKKYASHPKKLQITVVRKWILYKKVRERICPSPPMVELGGSNSKDWYGCSMNKKAKYIRAERCQKGASHPKKLQIKVVRN